jgi:hypothetical protein
MTEPSAYMPPLDCQDIGPVKRPTLLVTRERSPALFLLATAELERCLEGESHFKPLDWVQPLLQPVPTGAGLVHQNVALLLKSGNVVGSSLRCGGSEASVRRQHDFG